VDLNTLLLIALVAVVLIRTRATSTYLPASANDWFVIFNVDAKEKLLTLWFYPVVGFRLEDDGVTPNYLASFGHDESCCEPPRRNS
jgi:hypothetical protein